MTVRVDRLEILAAHLEALQKTPIKKRARVFNIAVWHSRQRIRNVIAAAQESSKVAAA